MPTRDGRVFRERHRRRVQRRVSQREQGQIGDTVAPATRAVWRFPSAVTTSTDVALPAMCIEVSTSLPCRMHTPEPCRHRFRITRSYATTDGPSRAATITGVEALTASGVFIGAARRGPDPAVEAAAQSQDDDRGEPRPRSGHSAERPGRGATGTARACTVPGRVGRRRAASAQLSCGCTHRRSTAGRAGRPGRLTPVPERSSSGSSSGQFPSGIVDRCNDGRYTADHGQASDQGRSVSFAAVQRPASRHAEIRLMRRIDKRSRPSRCRRKRPSIGPRFPRRRCRRDVQRSCPRPRRGPRRRRSHDLRGLRGAGRGRRLHDVAIECRRRWPAITASRSSIAWAASRCPKRPSSSWCRHRIVPRRSPRRVLHRRGQGVRPDLEARGVGRRRGVG